MVEVQVGEHQSGHGAEVDLLGQPLLLLQPEVAERGALAVAGLGVGHGVGMQAGVDEDALALGLDQVGGHRQAQRPLGLLVALAPEARGGRHPAEVEHFDLHSTDSVRNDLIAVATASGWSSGVKL